MRWLLQKDTDARAMQYYVSHLRRAKQWALRVTPGTPENEKYVRDFPGDVNPYIEPRMRERFASAQAIPDEMDAILSGDKYRETNTRFEELYKRKNREPQWYQPSGPSSMANLAKCVGCADEYRGFYESFSDSAHGSRFADSLDVRNGAVAIEPIRTIDQGGTILTLAFGFGLRSYVQVLEHFRPEELGSFRATYANRWMDRLRGIRNIEVVKDTVNVESWAV
jgi:hypothetical protein